MSLLTANNLLFIHTDKVALALSLVVVVSTSRSENSTQRSQLFTQFAVVSAVFTSQSDIFSQWEIVKKFDLVQNNN